MSKQKKQSYRNSCLTPIYQNIAYFFEDTAQVRQYYEGKVSVGRYGRYDNPNWLEFENKIAALDNYESALIFSSGMNAITTTACALLEQNDTLAYTGRCYRKTKQLFRQILPKWGIKTISINPTNNDNNFSNKCLENAKMVFLEMPSNPHLYLVDITKIKRKMHADALLVVDSTLSTPLNFQAQKWGADLTIHSCSKYIGGHGDVLAGSVAGSKDLIEHIRNYRNIMGGVTAPNTASLLNRSLETLEIRMQHFNTVGLEIAEYLYHHHQVKQVFYTGLKTHPHHHLAKKYLTGHGGVISFELDMNEKATSKFVDALQIPCMGSNFGSGQAMIEQCSIFTYYNLSPQERQDIGISDSLVRLSIGYGNSDALIEDIDKALEIANH
ncbi:Cys/Met metabolism pyridoxal-phosphate-dependent protein [[Leptolyngbya] sp. PCC 7376]|uniref:PLP-dependent transferase n=1 Tax=[Leptolyngbya] sp. PCC 7376 TaxID=111781 RepID=UPI00029EDB3B|nr:PLP-dependent transferase [[Leptolyngbya] sp. PCC 7376]AFY39673.1 Cys/Met metabolism pyridoxal-phosphate-dependent protein [[Leptolyngbya] sp. PCC 7376]